MAISILKRRWFIALMGCGCIVGGLLAALVFYLPGHIEQRILPRLAAAAGFDPGQLEIRRVGLTGADIGPIQLRLNDAPCIDIPAIQINYSIVGLFRRSIDDVIISGMQLTLSLNHDATGITGLTPTGAHSAHAAPVGLETLLPFEMKRVQLRNALITLQWRDVTSQIPTQMDLDLAELKQGRLRGAMRLLLRGHPVNITADADTRANRLHMRMAVRQLETARFSELSALMPPLSISAHADLAVEAHGTLNPLALVQLEADARLNRARILGNGLLIENLTDDEGNPQPVTAHLSFNGQDWQWSLAPFQGSMPFQVQVLRLEGKLNHNPPALSAAIRARSRMPRQTLVHQKSAPVMLTAPLTLQWTVDAGKEGDAPLILEAHAQVETPAVNHGLDLQQGNLTASIQAPHLSFGGRIEQQRLMGRVSAGADGIEVRNKDFRFASPKPAVVCDLDVAAQMTFDIDMVLSQVLAEAAGTFITLPAMQIKASLSRGKNQPWQANGRLSVDDGTAQNGKHALRMEHLFLNLPFQWPVTRQLPEGKLMAGPLLWNSRNIGTFAGKVTLKPDALETDIGYASKLFPGLDVQIISETKATGTKVTLSLPRYAPAAAIDVGRLFPRADWAAGMTVDGGFEAHADLTVGKEAVKGEAVFQVIGGTLRQLRRQLAVEDITCDLRLTNLQTLRSAPGQHLRAAKVTMGKIMAQDIQVDFQIEPDRTLLIEKAAVGWCRGLVQTAAMRLRPGLDDISTTLHCDRLDLAMMLDQLGAASGSGDGSLNGRVPVRWEKDQLSFNDGFLYSTPGQSGTLRLNGMKGLAPGSRQQVQLDIATEALRDYTYDWAILRLGAQKEHLILSLELAGKPNRPLPFTVDPQTGNFKQTPGQALADFERIGITINFNTPFNAIMKYKDIMRPN